MKITIIGSGGSAVSAKRACPSIVVNDEIVLDLGPAALKNLRASRLRMESISKVVISHTHADHISDLIPFLWAIQIDGREEPLEVYGPLGFKKTFRNLLECMSTPEGFFKFPLQVSELDFGVTVDEISTCQSSHSIPTLSVRIDLEGRAICYSADTTYCPAIVSLAHDADLLIHEATFLEDQRRIAELTCHSTAQMAGRAAREARAKRLVLFHIPQQNEYRENDYRNEAIDEYDGKVIIAQDLTSIEF